MKLTVTQGRPAAGRSTSRRTLTALKDKVRLDGDPQHAGFHFRANAEVEKTKNETYFLRPDGKGEKGKEVNWDPKTRTARRTGRGRR